MLQASPQLRQELGGAVQVMPPVSQSSMSQSINGRSSKTVTLLMPVVGPSGSTAQVRGGSPAAVGAAWAPAVMLCCCSPCRAPLATRRPHLPHSWPCLQAQVQYVEGGGGPAAEQLRVSVRLPSGRVLDLDAGGVPGAGQVIDVDWRSVDDK